MSLWRYSAASIVYKMMGIALSSDSSHTALVTYGAAPDPPQPLPRGLGRAENERDTQITTQAQIQAQVRTERRKTKPPILVSKQLFFLIHFIFSACSCTSRLAISRLHLHGIFNHPRGHQRPGAQGNQAGQGFPAFRHKVSMFYHLAFALMLTHPPPPAICLPRLVSQPAPYFEHLLLPTMKMFPLNCRPLT